MFHVVRVCSVFVLLAFFFKQTLGYRISQFDGYNLDSGANLKNVVDPSSTFTKLPPNLWSLQDIFDRLQNDETADADQHSTHSSRNWMKFRSDSNRSKRSVNSGTTVAAAPPPSLFDSMSNEIITEEMLNAPLSQLDLELIERSPLLKRLLIRILYYLQEKRNREFNPRLGRRSVDECAEFARQPYAPRLGKKDVQFTPRLGRGYPNSG